MDEITFVSLLMAVFGIISLIAIIFQEMDMFYSFAFGCVIVSFILWSLVKDAD